MIPGAGMACACAGDDAKLALLAIRANGSAGDGWTGTLIDESHFIVRVMRCGVCGRAWLSVFTEAIDWTGGDDSQRWMYTPLGEEEVGAIRELSERAGGVSEADLMKFGTAARTLVRDWPSGQEETVEWKASSSNGM